MLAHGSLGEYAIGESRTFPETRTLIGPSTVISQYQNSPVIMQLVANMEGHLTALADFDRFFELVWNVDSASGYGLDVWGRIVGVSRILHIPIPTAYVGFSQAGVGEDSFDQGIFFNGNNLTSNFALTDAAYRKLIFAKALANISDCSIPSINQILINLFSQYGNCYAIDNLNMTVTYSFAPTLTPVDNAIVLQSGVIPKPLGAQALFVQR
jgi:hypothetical protein